MKSIPLFFILIALVACNPSNNEQESNTKSNLKMDTKIPKNSSPTLQSILNEKKSKFEEKASDEKKKLYADGIQAVVDSRIEKTAKQVNDSAPDFSLNNVKGKSITLSEELKNGPVILTWYRGGWCPYCNLTLNRLQEDLPAFEAQGAKLLALTPELPDKSLSTAEKNELQFEVLSDVGNKVARKYGIVYELIEEVAESYQNGFDLHGYNGDQSNELPLSATYVIDQSGKIKYAFLDAEYRNRAEPADILKVLKELKNK